MIVSDKLYYTFTMHQEKQLTYQEFSSGLYDLLFGDLDDKMSIIFDLLDFKEMIDKLPNRKEEIAEAAEIHIKYKGYIEREKMVADKMHRLENIKIKGRFDYPNLTAVSTEARQKLERIQPETLAQASRIPGVSPSDINAMLVLMGR